MQNTGYIHVYYGFGKGKTTAALGLALRAAGYKKKVVIVQFLKNIKSGEEPALSSLGNITLMRGQASDSFTYQMNRSQLALTRRIHDMNFYKALELVSESKCDMLILDEVLDAYQMGLIDPDAFENFVKNKPKALELVLTGHMAEGWILESADYISEMVKKKHPYDAGIKARAGIEF